jgi:hypothetical protein
VAAGDPVVLIEAYAGETDLELWSVRISDGGTVGWLV